MHGLTQVNLISRCLIILESCELLHKLDQSCSAYVAHTSKQTGISCTSDFNFSECKKIDSVIIKCLILVIDQPIKVAGCDVIYYL